jgi:hypothetical protein
VNPRYSAQFNAQAEVAATVTAHGLLQQLAKLMMEAVASLAAATSPLHPLLHPPHLLLLALLELSAPKPAI